MKNLDVFGLFLLIRLASVFIVQTWFVPDEYWQSLEVAHNFVFGYGYLTWEWILGIRSYLHPLIIAFFYKLLLLMNLDYAEVLIYFPRILQAILSAYADLCFYEWSGTKKWAVFTITTSWFWFYTASRTIINSLETALTTIALAKFPWDSTVINYKFIWIVSFLCLIRPTAVIQWIPLFVYYLLISKEKILAVIIKRILPIGIISFLISILIDSLARGTLIITSYEFLKANVVNNVGEWYGSEPWHWYLSNGFPAMVGIQIAPFVVAVIHIVKNKEMYKNELALLGCIIFTIVIYSGLSHKEFRFILPLLPITLYISSAYLSSWSRKANQTLIWFVAGGIFIGNVIPAVFFSTIHQRGTIDVMVPLREIAMNNPQNVSFLFLMPCHSTPLYSHLHINITTRFLTCEPNLEKKDNYVDEADLFYNNPSWWLQKHYHPSELLPSHVILFDSLEYRISDFLRRYKPLRRIFHTKLPTERVGEYIIIHERVDFEKK